MQIKHKSRKHINKIILIILLAIFCLNLTGCYDNSEVDEVGYVMAFGVDKGKSNRIRLTVQIAIPKAISGSSSGNGGGGGQKDQSSIVTTVEAASVLTGCNMINNYVSRKLNFSHAKVLIISEELAKEGIDPYILGPLRNREFRPTISLLVCKGTAEKFINSVKPQLELNPAKYYDLTIDTREFTAMIPESYLYKFHIKAQAYDQQPIAILAGINQYSDKEDITYSNSSYKEKNRPYPLGSEFTAGNIPRLGGSKSEVMGAAIFDGDKMVGEIDGTDVSYYLLTTGEYKESYWGFPDPENNDKVITLIISQARKPSIKVTTNGEKPVINANFTLEGDIVSIQSGINYETTKNISKLQDYIGAMIQKDILRFYKETADKYNSDIFGFGRYAKVHFIYWNDWEKYNWVDQYAKSDFHVNLKLNIRRTGLLNESSNPKPSQKGRTR